MTLCRHAADTRAQTRAPVFKLLVSDCRTHTVLIYSLTRVLNQLPQHKRRSPFCGCFAYFLLVRCTHVCSVVGQSERAWRFFAVFAVIHYHPDLPHADQPAQQAQQQRHPWHGQGVTSIRSL